MFVKKKVSDKRNFCIFVIRKMSIKIILSSEVQSFIQSQPLDVRAKIHFNIDKIEFGIYSVSLFKKLKGSEIWELRTQYGGMSYRILAFWDKEQQSLVIATHGFVKKTQKTPKKEIAKAIAIMTEYYNTKK